MTTNTLLNKSKVLCTHVEAKKDNDEGHDGEEDNQTNLSFIGARRDSLEESTTVGTEMFVLLELVEIEGEKRADTAEAVADGEPHPAKGGGDAGHGCPDSDVTFWAELCLGTHGLSILKITGLVVRVPLLHNKVAQYK